ncbi:MAG: molecular chaperone [Clostridia bacterium]|jgi:fimbrial chaperone protein
MTTKTVLAMLLAATVQVAALSVTPMTVELTETGTGSTASFRIENDGDSPIAVIISIKTRSIELDGTENNEPVGTDFLVLPSRLVLEPRTTRVVKVQWRGTRPLSYEQAYRVMVEQVPVAFGEAGGSGIRILFRYIAALYVVPAGASGRLSLGTVTASEVGGEAGFVVRIDNVGDKHFITEAPRLVLRGGEQELDLSGDSLKGLEGLNVLARSSREVFIPWAAASTGTAYEGVFSAERE